MVLLDGRRLAALAWGAIGVMMLTGYAPIWLLSVAAALAGIAGSLIYPALNGIIPDLVPESTSANAATPGWRWVRPRLGSPDLAAGGAVVVWLAVAGP